MLFVLLFMAKGAIAKTGGRADSLPQEATAVWSKKIIDGGNVYAQAIRADSNGYLHMSVAKGGFLYYIQNKTGNWVKSTVDNSGNVGGSTSIVVAGNGKVHISYHDYTNSALKYATNATGAWVTKTIDNSGDVGSYNSIAVDAGGKIHISYYDNTNGDLKYATNATGAWVTKTIDNSGDVGGYNSIAIDGNGKVHISYYGNTNGDLKYATNATGAWVTKTIDNSGDVGWSTSIAVDGNGKVHISYHDYTNAALKYATNVTGAWVSTVVHGNWPSFTSIAVDGNGKVHISYRDGSYYNGNLLYSTNATGAWVTTTVANSIGDESGYTSIAIDGNGKVHISYLVGSGYIDLQYATNTSGAWVTTTLDDSGWVGEGTSIAVDSGGKVHISYSSESSNTLIYATTNIIDNTPPTDGELTTAPGNGQVLLNWTAATDTGSGIRATDTYKLVMAQGTTPPANCSGTAIYQGTALSYTNTGLTNGLTYSYLLCAYDYAGNASTGATATATLYINKTPTFGTLTPSVLLSAPDIAQTFTAIYSDANGYADIKNANLRVGTAANGIYLRYDRTTNKIYLYNDAGTATVGSCTPGNAGTLTNTQGSLNCAATTVAKAGNDLTINWNIKPKTAFASETKKNLYMLVRDMSNTTVGWTDKGDWTIKATNAAPTLGTLTPSVLTSAPAIAKTFTAIYSDADGYANIKQAYLRVHTAANGIYLRYDRTTNKLYLYDDAGTATIGSCTPGATKTLTNKQGSLDCATTTVAGSGNNLTIKWNIKPKAAFASVTKKNLYMLVRDMSNVAAGWTDKGDWTMGGTVNFGEYFPVDTSVRILTTTIGAAEAIGNTYVSRAIGTEMINGTQTTKIGIPEAKKPDEYNSFYNVTNDGITLKLWGEQSSTFNPPWSFGILSDGDVTPKFYTNITDRTTQTTSYGEAGSPQLIDIRDVTVSGVTYPDALVMFALDENESVKAVNFGSNTLGFPATYLPNSNSPLTGALTGFTIYAKGIGMIADGDIDAATGNFEALIELTSFVSKIPMVDAGYYYTCGLKTDGTVACWGIDDYGQSNPPAGTFIDVSAGGFHTCGVKTDGTVACWGYNGYGASTPPSGTFTEVSAGDYHTCGLKTNGTVACWGYNNVGQSTSPSGTFTEVSAGSEHTCGLKTDGTVACWGAILNGELTPPSGTFTDVSAGWNYTCGVKTDGTVACWGDNGYGESTPPSGTFIDVSSESYHTCGVKTDGTVACWGYNGYGEATPPSGTFIDVSIGGFHTCGVKTDGTVACWGLNDAGQAPVVIVL
jgi:hypothetical protein